jgi:hypothetical protein
MLPIRQANAPATPPTHQPVRQQYLELRASVHRKLLNRLNLEALANADRSRAEGEIRSLLGLLLSEEATPLSLTERESLFAEVLDDVFGLGPLEPLLRDPAISDILVNTYRNVFVERKGVLERVTATSRTTPISCASSIASSAASAGASTTARRWSMRVWPMARASTRSSRRSRWTVRCSRFDAFPPNG